jgi:hypothetical protein
MVQAQQPWQALSALPAWQLTQVPSAPQPRNQARADGKAPGDRPAQLTSAWCRGAPVAIAWVREPAGLVRASLRGGCPDLAEDLPGE